MKKVITLFAFVISVLSFAQHKIKKIDSIVNSKLAENDPGIAVGIIKDGIIIYEKYRGLSNLQHQIKFDEKTKSNIASTAKQFTALMILDLELKNKLNLEDDIRKHLPGLYKNVKEEIKIRHLINHTSGVRDYVELLDLEGEVWWKRFGLDNDDINDLLKRQNDLGLDPGTTYSYSNSNYILITKIIEKISAQSFNAYSKAFFEGLGMKNTEFVEKYMRVIPNRANPYSDWGSGEWFDVPTVTKTNGEGFLFTTLKDQLIYEQAVQNAIKDKNNLLIKSQNVIPNSEIQTYGFGLELKDQLGHRSVYHSGGTYGFNSQVDRYPEQGLAIFAMSNNGNISTNLIAKEIAKVILPKSTKKKTQYHKRYYESLSASEKSQLLGQYRYPDGILTRVVQKENQIYIRQGKWDEFKLIAERNHIYHPTYNDKQKIIFYKDEMVLFNPSGSFTAYKRVNEPHATSADLERFVGTYHNGELEISFDLKLTTENNLNFKLSNEEKFLDVHVFNRNELLAGNDFTLRAERDVFGRVTSLLLSYGRAKNIRFKKKTNLEFQPEIKTENGTIQVTTIGSKTGDTSDILLTKNDPNGNEIWSKRLGGSSWDKASSILATDDGYLIIGSTSSYGKGNYDVYVIKTDKSGKQLWQNTYGDFYNDYGYSAEKTDTGFLIKGTIQTCSSNSDVLNRICTTNVWFLSIDEDGNELSNKFLEELD